MLFFELLNISSIFNPFDFLILLTFDEKFFFELLMWVKDLEHPKELN